jgi:tRNA/tmRNA/rRNA uracil-C5-methylase (TrmA/RlmC/RlmD family)
VTVGSEADVDVGALAHGGHCVARLDGQVVFVRHAIPGERVRIRITEQTAKYLRADAVEILTPSPHRVEPPCPYAGPGRCGGCDFQHVSIAEQRRLKAQVVSDTLRRIGRIEYDVTMEAADETGLGWRTRMRYAVSDGRPGMYAHRSHELVAIDRCLLAHPDSPEVLDRSWPDADAVQTVVSSSGERVIGEGRVHETVRGRSFRVDATGFWQVHPAAAATLVGAVLDGLQPRPGETALDLYSGRPLRGLPRRRRLRRAHRRIRPRRRPQRPAQPARPAEGDDRGRQGGPGTRCGRQAGSGVGRPGGAGPPRTGAGPDAVRAITELTPRRVAYVACDPAALARDLRTFLDSGYELAGLRAFDLFGMTHRVECVAILSR